MAIQARHGIQRLSNEILREILDCIEADPEKLVTLDKRAYLSQESFKPPTFPSPDQAQDLGNFRLTCKRFSELGAIHQYARVTTRFSVEGLRRLESIAAQPHLSQHVKKFSYMFPYFYEVVVPHRELILELPKRVSEVDPRHFLAKVDEGRGIIHKHEDIRILRKAFFAFSALSHIQILRIQDYEDSLLLRHLRHAQGRSQIIKPSWPRACLHSTKTVGEALLSSRSPCTRFSSPMLSTSGARELAAHPPGDLNRLVHQLTSLELHFDESVDLDKKMRDLSRRFEGVLLAAENLQAIHIGFPSHFPLDIPLEDLFHHIRWDNLIAFGIQGWKLHSDEIINLVRRHSNKLRGLRLRDVLLKSESRWTEVLTVLRDELKQLEWVSLRRIGYAEHFDEQMADVGIEIEDVPGGDSESGDDDDDEMMASISSEDEAGSERASNMDTDEDGDPDHNDENGPHANEMSFPRLSDTPQRWCGCSGHAAPSVEELGDDGVSVSNTQRKMWEKWCTRRCFHEDSRQIS